MKKLTWAIAATLMLGACGDSQPTEETATDTAMVEEIAPAASAMTIRPMQDPPGYVRRSLFSMNDSVVFYYDHFDKTGKINVNGTDYILDQSQHETDGAEYLITGKDITIRVSGCTFDASRAHTPEAGVYYGKAEKATVIIGADSAEFTGITIVDGADTHD